MLALMLRLDFPVSGGLVEDDHHARTPEDSEGVCVRVCWKRGEEVGSKAQYAAERASSVSQGPAVQDSRVPNEESFRNTAFLCLVARRVFLFDLVSFEANVRCGLCLFTGALLLLVFSVMEGESCHTYE